MPNVYTEINAQAQIEFHEMGAICVRGLFGDWVDILKQGVQRNYENPGPYFAENVTSEDKGSFWDDYCNWQTIPEFSQFIQESNAAELAAKIMQSQTAQFFHDHVLVKEKNTSKATPWHQDAPYYFIEGEQTVSFWLPLDPVAKNQSLRLVAGSNHWPKLIRPISWADNANFYSNDPDQYMDIPDIDNADGNDSDSGSGSGSGFNILEWDLEPGDAILFNYKTVHGARGNLLDARRRAFSMRWLGDDARYISRPGKTSPPFPGHNMREGQRLREDWFPVLWPRENQ